MPHVREKGPLREMDIFFQNREKGRPTEFELMEHFPATGLLLMRPSAVRVVSYG